MSYYQICSQCGAHLDPGEVCDCTAANYRQLTPESRCKVDGMCNLSLKAQNERDDSLDRFKRVIVEADGFKYIAFIAILCSGVGQDGADIVEGYSRQSFKRAVKLLRECQRQYPDHAPCYEEAVGHIRRVWLHRETSEGAGFVTSSTPSRNQGGSHEQQRKV